MYPNAFCWLLAFLVIGWLLPSLFLGPVCRYLQSRVKCNFLIPNHAIGPVTLFRYLYIVSNILVFYLWLWMSCWTYGKNNNLCLLNKFFVDSNNGKSLLWMLMLENSEILIVCAGSSQRVWKSLLEWLGATRGDSNGLWMLP